MADVVIAVDRPAGAASRRHLRIQADYHMNPTRHIRHSKQMLIDLEPQKSGDAP